MIGGVVREFGVSRRSTEDLVLLTNFHITLSDCEGLTRGVSYHYSLRFFRYWDRERVIPLGLDRGRARLPYFRGGIWSRSGTLTSDTCLLNFLHVDILLCAPQQLVILLWRILHQGAEESSISHPLRNGCHQHFRSHGGDFQNGSSEPLDVLPDGFCGSLLNIKQTKVVCLYLLQLPKCFKKIPQMSPKLVREPSRSS